jgi:hypothetical protein
MWSYTHKKTSKVNLLNLEFMLINFQKVCKWEINFITIVQTRFAFLYVLYAHVDGKFTSEQQSVLEVLLCTEFSRVISPSTTDLCMHKYDNTRS